MTRKNDTMAPDLIADPFGEQMPIRSHKALQLLGARFEFESNSPELLRLVDAAYAGLPRHRLSAASPRLKVRLLLRPAKTSRPRGRFDAPPLDMFSGAGFLGGATDTSDFVVLSPRERAALVVVSPQMMRFPYHTRYELIEFAVFSLASRSQGLVSLHAACVGRAGRGILLVGSSGAGKTTVTLHCLLQGFDILSEDSVFVAPDGMLATGVANYLHIRADSLRWLKSAPDRAVITESPVIRRRSGVKKFEVDLRSAGYRLAASPLKIAAIVFLSAQGAAGGPLLKSLSKSDALAKLICAQAYAANQPEWTAFGKSVRAINAFELRRGRHPLEAVGALKALLEIR